MLGLARRTARPSIKVSLLPNCEHCEGQDDPAGCTYSWDPMGGNFVTSGTSSVSEFVSRYFFQTDRLKNKTEREKRKGERERGKGLKRKSLCVSLFKFAETASGQERKKTKREANRVEPNRSEPNRKDVER